MNYRQMLPSGDLAENEEILKILNKKNIKTFDLDRKVSENLNKLLDRTGYSIVHSNGQRIYSAPEGMEPAKKGCEVFIGKLPRDMFEYEIVPIFERCGKILQLRLMMDFNGYNRGYGFLTYSDPKEANDAVRTLNGYPVRQGKSIGVYKSVDNCRLFVGGVPVEKSEEQIKVGLENLVDGIVRVIMYRSHEDKSKNRGFVFIEFFNHKMAAMARRKLTPGSFVLWGVPLLVDWADPIPEVEPEVMKKVNKLYFRNLPIHLSRDQLYFELLKYVSAEYIVKTYKNLDYAFVHFVSRKIAEESLELLQGITIEGEPIEVTWARPKMYSKKYRESNPPDHFCTSLPPRIRKQIISSRVSTESGLDTPNMSPSQSTYSNSVSSNNSAKLLSAQNLIEDSLIQDNNVEISNYVPMPTAFRNGRAENFNSSLINNANYINPAFHFQGIPRSTYNMHQLGYIPQGMFTNQFSTNIGPRQYY